MVGKSEGFGVRVVMAGDWKWVGAVGLHAWHVVVVHAKFESLHSSAYEGQRRRGRRELTLVSG